VTLTATQIGTLKVAAAAADQPQALLEAVARVAQEATGCALFTVMRFHENDMEVERLYSTNTATYPVGGRKAKRDTDWGRHVLTERKLFVGEGEAALRAAFDDHATIFGLGLRSMINVPVVYADACVGTMNFSFRSETVPPGAATAAMALALIGTPALMPDRR